MLNTSHVGTVTILGLAENPTNPILCGDPDVLYDILHIFIYLYINLINKSC